MIAQRPDVSKALERAVHEWSGKLNVLPNGAFGTGSQIRELPWAIAECFNTIDHVRLERFTFAICLFSDAVVICDDVIDSQWMQGSANRKIPDAMALFAESYRLFSEVFGTESPFWNRLRRYFADYIESMEAEADFATGRRPWESATEQVCEDIARGKNGLVRLVAAGVCEIAGDDNELAALAEKLLGYFVASQLIDDIKDWRDDLRSGNISMLLRRASASKPEASQEERIRRAIHLDGHITYLLDRAEAISRAALRDLPPTAVRLQRLLAGPLHYAVTLKEELLKGILPSSQEAEPGPESLSSQKLQ